MCYHTTYLFSLCGHISISFQPVKDTQPCQDASKTHDNEAASTHARLRSSIDLLSSFPSPQEFEFAKVLHDSLPASPISPLQIKQDTGNFIDAYIAQYDTVTSTAKARNISISTKMDNVNTQCPIIKRHPLHTFLIPDLCRFCREARERNIARFEAEAIKDSVEMALTAGSRHGKGPQGTGSVVNDERRKISPPRGKKGTIPLILSTVHSPHDGESASQSKTNAEGRTSGEVGSRVDDSSSSSSTETVSTDTPEAIASKLKTTQQARWQTEGSEKPDSRDTRARNVSALVAGAGMAPSWWRWRKPSTNTVMAIPATSGAEDPPSSASVNSRRNSSVKTDTHRRSSSTLLSPSSPSGLSRLSWRGKYAQDVQRDGLGRSTKGMDRIMRWSKEEENDK